VEDVFSYFEKPKNQIKFNAMKISIASPDKILSWSRGEVKNRKQLTTGHLNRKKTDFFAQRFSGR
jgi:RNA polymerase Rpb1, domain 1.